MKREFLICFVVFLLFLGISPVRGEGHGGAGTLKDGGGQFRKVQKRDRRPYPNKIISQLSDIEKKRLRELQKSDANAFRRELKKIVAKYKAEHNKKSKEIRDLIKKFHSSEGDEKNAVKEKITEFVRAQFVRKMEVNKKNYEKAAKRLEELKKRLNARENNAEIIIKERVRELTKDPDLMW